MSAPWTQGPSKGKPRVAILTHSTSHFTGKERDAESENE